MKYPHPKKENLPIIIPVVIVFITICIWVFLASNRPEATKRSGQQASSIVVDVIKLEAQEIQPRIRSYGTIEAQVTSKLVAQVSGRIKNVSEQFRDGGYFKKGDLLLTIEAVDYEIEVEIAEANRLDAERMLEEEQARVKIAEDDWRRLGSEKEPAALVLRRPQLKAAQASLKAAQARLRRAELNLNRTQIRAPFNGRVISTNVDLGQVVSNNAVLGDIYASGVAEVRLPIKTADLSLIDISSAKELAQLEANISSNFDSDITWPAKITRSASALDDATRQLYLVAEINGAFETNETHPHRLRVGQYVTATILGENLDSALALPNEAVSQGSYVYVYEDGAVFRREITMKWQDERLSIIESGVTEGEQIVVSPLGNVASGTRVRLTGEQTGSSRSEKQNRGAKPS